MNSIRFLKIHKLISDMGILENFNTSQITDELVENLKILIDHDYDCFVEIEDINEDDGMYVIDCDKCLFNRKDNNIHCNLSNIYGEKLRNDKALSNDIYEYFKMLLKSKNE